MLQKFYPDEYLESAYSIDYSSLYRQGYRGILFDIDNTLVPHGADAQKKTVELFRLLKKTGFSACLISNNREERVKRFNQEIAAPYIFKAGKPSVKGYHLGMEKMGTTKETTLFIGDQLFTDVFGAKRAGIHSILVKPIDPKEEIQIVLKRYLENIVLLFYKREQKRKR